MLAPEDPCRILIYFPQKIIQIVTRFEIVVLVPPGVAVSPVEQPFRMRGTEAKLGHNDINPPIGLHESRPLFKGRHIVAANSVTQSDILASMIRNALITVFHEPTLDLISSSLGNRQSDTRLKPWPANALEVRSAMFFVRSGSAKTQSWKGCFPISKAQCNRW
jgi:hypothetical protein